MPDVFQFYAGSADAAPGKGSGEMLESSADYKPLRAIAGWRRILANANANANANADSNSSELLKILPLTHSAELWHAPLRKPRVRATELETLREAQRIAPVEEAEAMDSKTVPKVAAAAQKPAAKAKAPKASKAKAKATAEESEAKAPEPLEPFGVVPENSVAVAQAQEAEVAPPDLEAPEENTTAIRFCPVCRYYLYLQTTGEEQTLHRMCRNCGYTEQDEKGGLVMEMMVQQRSAEGYKILLNEFTRKDPRLPHIHKNIKCPDQACKSNHGTESDVIYIKYDIANLLYLYICDVCGYQWRSKR